MTTTPDDIDATPTATSEPLEDAPLSLSEHNEPEVGDAMAQVLLRIMGTDPETNIVLGRIPKGEAEDFAAAVTYAEFSGSPVILRYENMKNMAKRAEGGSLLDKILGTVKAIGKNPEPRGGIFRRIGGK